MAAKCGDLTPWTVEGVPPVSGSEFTLSGERKITDQQNKVIYNSCLNYADVLSIHSVCLLYLSWGPEFTTQRRGIVQETCNLAVTARHRFGGSKKQTEVLKFPLCNSERITWEVGLVTT